ncbi:hypothetical protein D9615_008358 [Tricholomella constricta]|uniref:Uncharacterized protein n=1 Tax=Tricholomella constricta TaxID=117010 RepID=A0A8H5HE04_9AGAR|nr:hypothetical protein D9615_008358 [Tricholomella constricta]
MAYAGEDGGLKRGWLGEQGLERGAKPPRIAEELGWQFVPQYYTFVNKHPNRLHCFYTKSSTFIHGTEGEEGKPCYGQQEIHNKITSIGFQDCKVFIHSVDAQSSANGGIIIQVIGEMSNHGEPWRKFVQTFFLAEQPNGYFVLNDIFRFLKEEAVESDDASETADVEAPIVTEPVPAAAPAPASPAPAPAAALAAESVSVESSREPSPPPATTAAAPPPPAATEEEPTTDVPEPTTPAPEPAQPSPTSTAAVAQPNGVHTPAAAPEPEKAPTPAPAPAPAAVPAQEKAPVPAPAPTPAAAPASTPPPAAAAKPAPPAPAPAPAAPRSWASLAASNSNRWGAAVAQESRGVTESPVAPPAAPAPAAAAPVPSGTQTPPRGPQHHHHHHQQSQQGFAAAQNVTIAQCFVKGVTEPISQTLLSTTLAQRFGPIKDLEIVRSKACAFLEFTTLDAARRAIAASPIWIDVGGDVGQLRIAVETKRERGDRPAPRPRGGAPGGGAGGAGGGSGSGNGGPQQEGGRGGYRGRGGAPRGRGAPQAK